MNVDYTVLHQDGKPDLTEPDPTRGFGACRIGNNMYFIAGRVDSNCFELGSVSDGGFDAIGLVLITR